jgi:RHS repeat-associated protein
VTNLVGTVAEWYEYSDFGQPIFLRANQTVMAASPILNTRLFNGREYDPETGLYYYRTRYLDPATGRFTTRDSIGIWGDPANLGNGYTYVGNNPWTLVDPYGLGWWDTITGAASEVGRTLYYLPEGYLHSITRGEQADSISGAIDGMSRRLFFGYSTNIGPQYGHTAYYRQGSFVGDQAGNVMNAAMMVSGAQGLAAGAKALQGTAGAVSVGEGALALQGALSTEAAIAAGGMALNAGKLGASVTNMSMGGEGSIGDTCPGQGPRLPSRGTAERRAIDAARQRGIALKQEQELANIRAGGRGSGSWSEAELRQIRETGQFPADAQWHHNPTVANRPDLADNPSSVEIIRGGRQAHFEEGHQGNWQNPK